MVHVELPKWTGVLTLAETVLILNNKTTHKRLIQDTIRDAQPFNKSDWLIRYFD